jgi:hypothetical protein
LPIGSRVSTQSFQPGYASVLDMISSDPLLAAPFYHYPTPGFAKKREAIEAFNRTLNRKLGNLILEGLLQNEAGICTS